MRIYFVASLQLYAFVLCFLDSGPLRVKPTTTTKCLGVQRAREGVNSFTEQRKVRISLIAISGCVIACLLWLDDAGGSGSNNWRASSFLPSSAARSLAQRAL